jgi:hypothetical protein
MTWVAVLLFAVAAVVGATMAVQRLQGRPLPATGVALAHGGVAAVALVLLIVAAVTGAANGELVTWAIGIFVVAALGGAVMFLGYHLRQQALPVALVFAHGGLAVIAFVVLLAALLGVGT